MPKSRFKAVLGWLAILLAIPILGAIVTGDIGFIPRSLLWLLQYTLGLRPE